MRRFQRIYIEISNVCNVQCSFCPTVDRQKQVMSAGQFRSVLERVAPHTSEVYLHLMGEPLGHPQLAEIIQACTDLKVAAKITTNGLLLIGNKVDLLLQPIVRQVNFSLHSFTDNFAEQSPRTYLQRLFKFAARARLERPDLYVNFRLWDLNEEQQGLTVNAAMRQMINDEFQVDLERLRQDVRRRKKVLLGGRIAAHFDSRFVWPALDAPRQGTRGTCHGLGTHVGIHADGTVVPCCLDKEAVLRLGNIFEQSLDEVAESPRAEAMRAGFERGELVEALCQHCQFATRFRRKLSAAAERAADAAGLRPHAGVDVAQNARA